MIIASIVILLIYQAYSFSISGLSPQKATMVIVAGMIFRMFGFL